MELGLRGKRAVVLAASRGLGYACALGLAREGCDVAVCSRDADHINQAADQIRRETGARVHPVVADVSDEAAVKRLVSDAVSALGGLEIAVHNAGGPPAGSFDKIADEQWYKSFELNLMSFVWLVRAVTPEMKKAGYGRILTIASSSVKQPIPNLILSNAMRPGVHGVAKTIAKELAPDGILVNTVVPGRIATERIDELDRAAANRTGKSFEAIRQETVEGMPLGRLGRPEELANLVVFLASEAASYISGTAIQVDGAKLDSIL